MEMSEEEEGHTRGGKKAKEPRRAVLVRYDMHLRDFRYLKFLCTSQVKEFVSGLNYAFVTIDVG